jgi:hypothetical protein
METDGVQVVSGNPTPEELAAVIAVLEGMVAEQLEGTGRRTSHPDAWAAGQRAVRTPIVRGVTRWRTFG